MEKTLPESASGRPAPQMRFGGYAILEHLGKGGMGDVYKAVQLGLDRVVALKILPSFLARSREFSERFFSEAYAISRLQHQNIVTIYDYGEENDQKFIAMQYVQGCTLSQLLQREKKLDYGRIINITKQIGRGLKYAHGCDIVHRDIKSSNVMVEPGDKVYISDFGIAKVLDAPSITTTGMAMGTPEYMAPEQCEGLEVDGQSDMYGLGIILFEMITGKPPFLAETPLAVAYKQVHEPAPLVSRLAPDVPPRLELIVAKCLKKNKQDRYRHADDLLRDLDAVGYSSGTTGPLRRDGRWTRLKSRVSGSGLGRGWKNLPSPARLALGLLSAAALLTLLIFAASRWVAPARSAQGWLLPAEVHGAAEAKRIFDGKAETAWSPGKAMAGAPVRLHLRFSRKVVLNGLLLASGARGTGAAANGSGDAEPFSHPRFLTVEGADRKSGRILLQATEEAQFLPLPGLLADELYLVFEGASAPSPWALRELRFLGLPAPAW